MNLKLLPVLIVLFLTACGTRTVRDDSPASDLDVLVLNVQSEARPVLLPNGRDYCMELAASEQAQDECGGDLEDALYTSNKRAARILTTVQNFVAREKLRRNPCKWWQMRCKRGQ